MRWFPGSLLVFAWLAGAIAVPIPPDLQVEIADVHVTGSGANALLYFSTYTVNLGAGPIELRGGAVVNGMQQVYQRVFDTDGSYTDTLSGTYAVVNGKIKFQDSADYFLREVNQDNSVGDVAGSRQKVAYCLVDSFQHANPPPGSPTRAQYGGQAYPACGNVLGISVGWVDNYYYTIPNQSIPLNAISSGTYWLQNVIDPLQRLIESNETNNETHVLVTVSTSFASQIAVLGNGASILNNDTTPSPADHTDFGYADVANGSVTRTFTIKNFGDGQLSLTGVPRVKILGNSDFSVITQPASPVAPSGSITFQIIYDPTGMNSTADVQITSNDPYSGSFHFSIRGNASTGFVDTDGDGMPDDWESIYQLTDPAGDEDGDGVKNLDEFIAGTSPRDAKSRFGITQIERVGNNCTVTWDSVKGRTYKLYATNDPATPMPWTLLGQYAGTGAAQTASENPIGSTPRFYRLTAQP